MASTLQGGASESLGRGVCSVVAVYEDEVTRNFAVELCNNIARHFEGDLEFNFTWLGLRYLSDPEVAQQTAEAAINADLIVVSSHGTADFPTELKAWFERWVSDHKSGDAALVLAQLPLENGSHALSQDSYLRLLALRARLDYLPLSGSASLAIPALRPPEAEIFIAPDADPKNQGPQYSSGWGIND